MIAQIFNMGFYILLLTKETKNKALPKQSFILSKKLSE